MPDSANGSLNGCISIINELSHQHLIDVINVIFMTQYGKRHILPLLYTVEHGMTSGVSCLLLPPSPCSARLATTIQASCLLWAWAVRGGGLWVWEGGPALVPPPGPGSGKDLQEVV